MLFLNGFLLFPDKALDLQVFGELQVTLDMSDLITEIDLNDYEVILDDDFVIAYDPNEYIVELC